jgi:hypothetical protein
MMGPIPEKVYVVFIEGHCSGCGLILKTGDAVVRLAVLKITEVDVPIVATAETPLEVLIHIDCFRYVFAKSPE